MKFSKKTVLFAFAVALALAALPLARVSAAGPEETSGPPGLRDGRPENVYCGCAGIAANIVDKFTPQAQKAGIHLELEIHAGLPVVIADGDRLAQVFTNLVDNALKFTSAGGKVTLCAAPARDEMELSVSDTGTGIPQETLPRLFDRFYQVDASRAGGEGHGAGLGLAIVKEIVQAHGGRISVRSELGHGTTFVIHLPLATI